MAHVANNARPRISLDEAATLILRQAFIGNIILFGIPETNMEKEPNQYVSPQEIPRSIFADNVSIDLIGTLSVLHGTYKEDWVDDTWLEREVILYWKISFPTHQMLSLWPRPTRKGIQSLSTSVPNKSRPPSLSALEKTYRDFVAEHVDAGSQPTVAETRQALSAAFPQHAPIAVRTIAKLRGSPATPAEWHRPGRSKANRNRIAAQIQNGMIVGLDGGAANS